MERAFDYSRSQAALTLLTKHRTPYGTRRTGEARIHAWLKKHGTRSSEAVAAAAIEAAKSQHTIVPAQPMGEGIVAALAREILTLNEELAGLDALISEKVTEHQHTQVLPSMPGFGPVLAAEFLGAIGGDVTVFQTADRFAGLVGFAPAPRDSGGIRGNRHRSKPYDRRLLRVFYLSGLSALKSCPASRGYYDRIRVEGKSHIQAMLSGTTAAERPLGHAPRRHYIHPYGDKDCIFGSLKDRPIRGCSAVLQLGWHTGTVYRGGSCRFPDDRSVFVVAGC